MESTWRVLARAVTDSFRFVYCFLQGVVGRRHTTTVDIGTPDVANRSGAPSVDIMPYSRERSTRNSNNSCCIFFVYICFLAPCEYFATASSLPSSIIDR